MQIIKANTTGLSIADPLLPFVSPLTIIHMHNAEKSQYHTRTLELIEQNPGLNMLPLLEMVVEETSDYLEAFCSQAIFTVSELLREDQSGGVLPGHVMQIIHQLHTLREVLRQLRGAPSWPQ